MTDNEIIKGINYCANVECRKNCDSCPIKAVCDSEDYGAIKLVADLINRQKVEIERLKKEVEFAYKVTKTHTVKEFLERLKNSRSSKRYHHFVSKSDINRVAEEMVGEG